MRTFDRSLKITSSPSEEKLYSAQIYLELTLISSRLAARSMFKIVLYFVSFFLLNIYSLQPIFFLFLFFFSFLSVIHFYQDRMCVLVLLSVTKQKKSKLVMMLIKYAFSCSVLFIFFFCSIWFGLVRSCFQILYVMCATHFKYA